MKRYIITKTAALLLAASMTLSLASCGSSDSSDKSDSSKSTTTTAAPAEESLPEESAADESQPEENKEITGETTNWGIYTFLLPEGWTLRGGDAFDDNDVNICSVKKSDFSYFQFKCEDEATQQRQYNYNKETYTLNQKDLPATTIAGIEWNGFEYGNEMSMGFELYGSTGGKFLRVSGVGFAFDSAEAKAVLGSLRVEGSSDDNGGSDPSGEMSYDEKTAVTFNGAAFTTGDNFEAIKDQLGNEAMPSDTVTPCTENGDAQDLQLYHYPGLDIQVNYEGTIISISISEEITPGTDAALACGLKLGDTAEKAKELLGEPDDENEFGLTYTRDNKSLTISTFGGVINLIGIWDYSLSF